MKNEIDEMAAAIWEELALDHDSYEKKIIQVLAESKRARKEIVAMCIAKDAGQTNHQVAIKVLRAFADAGLGTFIVGRRGKKSRLVCSDANDASRVLKVAQAVARLDAPPSHSSAGQTASEAEEYREHESVAADVKLPTIRHGFVLRPDFTVNIELPTDFAQDEASRLSKFVQALPFNNNEKEKNRE